MKEMIGESKKAATWVIFVYEVLMLRKDVLKKWWNERVELWLESLKMEFWGFLGQRWFYGDGGWFSLKRG